MKNILNRTLVTRVRMLGGGQSRVALAHLDESSQGIARLSSSNLNGWGGQSRVSCLALNFNNVLNSCLLKKGVR